MDQAILADGQARLAARVASVLLQHRRMRQVLRVVRQAHRLALQGVWKLFIRWEHQKNWALSMALVRHVARR